MMINSPFRIPASYTVKLPQREFCTLCPVARAGPEFFCKEDDNRHILKVVETKDLLPFIYHNITFLDFDRSLESVRIFHLRSFF